MASLSNRIRGRTLVTKIETNGRIIMFGRRTGLIKKGDDSKYLKLLSPFYVKISVFFFLFSVYKWGSSCETRNIFRC